MKLIVAVVRDEYAGLLTETLTRGGFSATKLASTGGFLRAGNSTFLIGVEEDKVPAVMQLIRETCPQKPAPAGSVPVAGATVFVLNVNSMVKV